MKNENDEIFSYIFILKVIEKCFSDFKNKKKIKG
jgi:hypothetical protein